MSLTNEEVQRLEEALKATWAVPFVDDIEGFVWESIFHYIKQLSIPDPLPIWGREKLPRGTRRPTGQEPAPKPQKGKTKSLFDAVDKANKIGWSLKALQCTNLAENANFEFVIQRASIFGKSEQLGFTEKLSLQTPPADLGRAIAKHWNDKVLNDMREQSVEEARLVILIKSLDRKQYIYIERPLALFKAEDFEWAWSNEKFVGLQAKQKLDGRPALKWYHSQTQLFECLTLPPNATRIQIEPKRMEVGKFVHTIPELLL
ncbi:MAG: hypothetical protein WCS37_00455 [Chloroflexota bacterium]|nr:hypothetical protein [Chloroflexota bacterium]